MAIVRVPHLGGTFIMPAQIEIFLAGIGVEYHCWPGAEPLFPPATPAQILNAYRPQLENYKSAHGFASYDVIELTAETPGIEDMLGLFSKEHWHDQEEARLIVAGRGVCNIHPAGRPVAIVELEPGDFLSVGRGIRHWFDLCAERHLRAVRFLAAEQETSYTQSGIEKPVCLGPPISPINPADGSAHSGSAPCAILPWRLVFF